MPDWTREQLEAIETRGANILVAAAAGSGKTAVLTERILRLVTEDRVPVSSLLVLTFTEAAAAEMRGRIEAAIAAALDAAEADGGDQADGASFLREQARRLRSAQISTFHSFALTILKNYYYVIDMEPAFRVCDEFRAEILKQDALDRLFEERFAGSPDAAGELSSAAFTDFLSRYSGDRNETQAREMILKVYDFIRSLPDPFGWLDAAVEKLGRSDEEFTASADYAGLCARIGHELADAADELTHLGDMLADGGAPHLAQKNAEDLACVRDAADVFDGGAGWDRTAAALDFTFQRFVSKKDEKENYDAIKDEVTAVRIRAKDRINNLKERYFARPLADMMSDIRDTRQQVRTLAGLVRGFHDAYSQAKRDEGVIDFNDIEHSALAILADARVAGELRAKYEHIFIDEYQDSNYVQEELAERVCRPGNRFMVGDVKQSIYRFRHAEPAIFAEKYRTYKSANEACEPDHDGGAASGDESGPCRRVDLNRNFRSKAPVIDAVNGVFSKLMGAGDGGGDADAGQGAAASAGLVAYDENAALRLGIDYDRAWDRPVELRILDMTADESDPSSQTSDNFLLSSRASSEQSEPRDPGSPADEEILAMKDAEREALAAAEIIREARGKPFYDTKRGIERPMGYGDMIVLMREMRNSGPIFTETLLGEGIEAYADSGEGYLDTVEIETFMNLLRVIDNMRQDVPLVSALYSPVFGFTTDELAEIRLALPERSEPYYKAFLACAASASALGAKCRAAAERIAGWRTGESFMELSDFLWLVLGESGWYDYAGALAGGERRRANLRAMTLRAAEYGTGRARGLFGFIRYIESVADKKLKIPQARLVTEGDDVVRVTTVHKSKGLEYPLVIIAGLGKRLSGQERSGRYLMHRELGLSLTWEDPERHTWRRTLNAGMIADRKAEEERAETLRVLYVAMTRAQDRLVMLGSRKKEGSAPGFLELLLPIADEAGIVVSTVAPSDLVRTAVEGVSARERARERLTALDAPEPSGSTLYAEVDRRLSFVYPHEAALRLKSKYSVSELNRKASEQARYYFEETEAAADEDSGLSAAEKGTALHKAFEKLDYAEAHARCAGDPDDGSAWAGAYLDGLAHGGFLSPEQRASVKAEDLMRFAASDICARVARSPRARRETPFNYRTEMNGERIIVQGVIDLFFEETDASDGQGALVLVDFKSGGAHRDKSARARHALAIYGEQLRLYREALEAITGKRVKESLLYLTSSGDTVPVP